MPFTSNIPFKFFCMFTYTPLAATGMSILFLGTGMSHSFPTYHVLKGLLMVSLVVPDKLLNITDGTSDFLNVPFIQIGVPYNISKQWNC